MNAAPPAAQRDVRIKVGASLVHLPRRLLSESASNLRQQLLGDDDDDDVEEVTRLELHGAPPAQHVDLKNVLTWCLEDIFPTEHFADGGAPSATSVSRLPELVETAVWLHRYGAGASYVRALQCWDAFWEKQRRQGFSLWVSGQMRNATVREVGQLLAEHPHLFGVRVDGNDMSCLEGPDGIVTNRRADGLYSLYLDPCVRRGDPPLDEDAVIRARAANFTEELRRMATSPQQREWVEKMQEGVAEQFQEKILHAARLKQKHRLTFTHKAGLEGEVAAALRDKRRCEEQAAQAQRNQREQEEGGDQEEARLERAQRQQAKWERLAAGAAERAAAKRRELKQVSSEELLVKVSFLAALAAFAQPELPLVQAVQAFPVGLDILTMLARARVLRDAATAMLPATVLDDLCVCIRSKSDDQFRDIQGDILDSPCDFSTTCGWERGREEEEEPDEEAQRLRKRARCKYAYFATSQGDAFLSHGVRGPPLMAAEQGNRGSNEQAFRLFEALADVVLATRPKLEIKTACAVCFKKRPAIWKRHLDAKKVLGDTAGVLRAASEAELTRI